MSDSPPVRTSQAPWLFRVLGKLLAPWIAIRREPANALPQIQSDLPVCYAIERYGLSNALILEQSCREAGLPSPLAPMPGDLLGRNRAVVGLSRRYGFWLAKPRTRTHSESLAHLVAALSANPELDVQLVPVSIFVGRAPDRTTGWFRVLFSENWAITGRFRRLLSILLNGRNTIVHFAEPISLRAAMAEEAQPERLVRKVSRVLRTHFRRIRTATIGPDLSHRRILIDGVLAAEPVREAIADQARRDNISPASAWRRAHSYAREIAADYSHTVIRSLSFVLTPFWNKIYRGVAMHHFDSLKQAAPGHEVVYTPSHRSHIDYLLLSYLLYTHGVVPPHIFAGVTLNLPGIGPILRKGGAFFARRSFRGNALYSAVFSEYMAKLVSGGYSIEYFIEGGRSRTGRLLQPKSGALVMTLRAYLRQPRKPVLFQPVYIGYEKLMEGKSYLDELSGQPKQKETVWALLRAAAGILRHNYGRVAVSYAEPIELDEVLDRHAPQGWRQMEDADGKPEWFGAVVDEVAQRIQENINRAADVNPINLLALCLLATPKFAMSEADLIAQIDLLKALLNAAPYSERVTTTSLSGPEVVAYGEEVGVLTRTRHPLGDVLSVEGERAVLQSYFRNNVQHLFASAAWVACCFQNTRRMSRAGVIKLGKLLYPFLKRELFLPWDEAGFERNLEANISAMEGLGLLHCDAESGQLHRGIGQTDEVFKLRCIANTLMQAFERYYIALAVLAKNGSGKISAGELETLCHLTAQRLSLLYAQVAPEFFDRSLFKGFIAVLREQRLIRTDENGKLVYDAALETWAKDAKLVLSREVIHSILKVTPEMARGVEPAAAED